MRVKRGQKFARHFKVFAEFLNKVCGDVFGQLGVVQAINGDAFGHLVAVGAVHEFQPVIQHVIAADEITSLADGPGGGRHVDGQHFLDFVNDLKGIAAFAVHFVAEGQDGQVAQAADLKKFLSLAFPHPWPRR